MGFQGGVGTAPCGGLENIVAWLANNLGKCCVGCGKGHCDFLRHHLCHCLCCRRWAQGRASCDTRCCNSGHDAEGIVLQVMGSSGHSGTVCELIDGPGSKGILRVLVGCQGLFLEFDTACTAAAVQDMQQRRHRPQRHGGWVQWKRI